MITVKLGWAKDFHCPVIKLAKESKLDQSSAVNFVKLHYQLILK